MVDDNYKGAETDKEAISDWGGGEGLGKSKTNIRAQRTKSHERAMRTIKLEIHACSNPSHWYPNNYIFRT